MGECSSRNVDEVAEQRGRGTDRRTHQGLSLCALLRVPDDATNVILETFVQHPIRLI
jgi:hypothetical protein